MSCDQYPSGMELWASQYEHHISTGGTLKCDDCRNDTWYPGHDGPAWVCRVCQKGFCYNCSGHACYEPKPEPIPEPEPEQKPEPIPEPEPDRCSAYTIEVYPSGMDLWAHLYQYKQHVESGGTLKCDDCRKGTWYYGHDGQAWVCRLCRKGFCENCWSKHSG